MVYAEASAQIATIHAFDEGGYFATAEGIGGIETNNSKYDKKGVQQPGTAETLPPRGGMGSRPRQVDASKLIRKWKTALDNYDGPGKALLLTEYRVDRHAPLEPETEVTG